jgi:hypothetical protein
MTHIWCMTLPQWIQKSTGNRFTSRAIYEIERVSGKRTASVKLSLRLVSCLPVVVMMEAVQHWAR